LTSSVNGISTRADPLSFPCTSIVGNSLGPASIGWADPHVPESTAHGTCSPAGTGAVMEISIRVPRDGSWIGVRIIEPNPLLGADRPSSEFILFALKLPVHCERGGAVMLPVVCGAQAANTTMAAKAKLRVAAIIDTSLAQ